jgi:PQQ-dependent catabolism-associated CXXCW motif protein
MRALFASLLWIALASAAAGQALEPKDLWTGPMHGETPATLVGAEVVGAVAVARLKHEGALLIDVAESPAEPAGISPDVPWIPTHLSIPGAIWLANAGLGNLGPEFQSHFAKRVAALTGDDKSKKVVVFCHPRCWGSWNAAKRLVILGYAHVYWFPGGVEVWEDKFSIAPVKPDATWNALNR